MGKSCPAWQPIAQCKWARLEAPAEYKYVAWRSHGKESSWAARAGKKEAGEERRKGERARRRSSLEGFTRRLIECVVRRRRED